MSLKAKVLMPALLPVVITTLIINGISYCHVEPQSRAGHTDNA
jgi:signal transduction histidine kinase